MYLHNITRINTYQYFDGKRQNKTPVYSPDTIGQVEINSKSHASLFGDDDVC